MQCTAQAAQPINYNLFERLQDTVNCALTLDNCKRSPTHLPNKRERKIWVNVLIIQIKLQISNDNQNPL